MFGYADFLQMISIRCIHLIRLVGMNLLIIYWLMSIVTAADKYSRATLKLDATSMIKTITDISEVECLLRCRIASNCKNTFYETGETSYCRFFDKALSEVSSKKEVAGTIHVKIGMVLLSLIDLSVPLCSSFVFSLQKSDFEIPYTSSLL